VPRVHLLDEQRIHLLDVVLEGAGVEVEIQEGVRPPNNRRDEDEAKDLPPVHAEETLVADVRHDHRVPRIDGLLGARRRNEVAQAQRPQLGDERPVLGGHDLGSKHLLGHEGQFRTENLAADDGVQDMKDRQ